MIFELKREKEFRKQLLQKYGINAFDLDMMCETLSEEDLDDAFKYEIDSYSSKVKSESGVAFLNKVMELGTDGASIEYVSSETLLFDKKSSDDITEQGKKNLYYIIDKFISDNTDEIDF